MPGPRAFPAAPAPSAAERPVPARVGVYVHFPWCLAKCPYCDFVSYVGDGSQGAEYADAVCRELDLRADAARGRRLESIFFGGGTPSLWNPADLGRVIAATMDQLDAGPGVEITVECNPSSLDRDKASRLRDVGVNRLSIGVQSLRDDRLRFLGRLHDAAAAKQAIAGALAADLRVSADLIFGLPDQTPGQARAEAVELAELGLDHVSCYQLTIEPGTRFGELARKGRLPLAEDASVADAFMAIDEALGERGLEHYEVSNYARPGDEARHNLGYWRGDEYLGLGCGAYGFARENSSSEEAVGTRWRNLVRPEAYVAAARAGGTAALTDSTERLDAETLLRERIMLGLRMREGMDLEASGRDLGVPGWTPSRRRSARALEARGRIAVEGDRIRIPPQAWLWTNDTSAALF